MPRKAPLIEAPHNGGIEGAVGEASEKRCFGHGDVLTVSFLSLGGGIECLEYGRKIQDLSRGVVDVRIEKLAFWTNDQDPALLLGVSLDLSLAKAGATRPESLRDGPESQAEFMFHSGVLEHIPGGVGVDLDIQFELFDEVLGHIGRARANRKGLGSRSLDGGQLVFELGDPLPAENSAKVPNKNHHGGLLCDQVADAMGRSFRIEAGGI